MNKFLQTGVKWLAAAIFFAGCSRPPGDLKEFRAWCEDPENGLVKERVVGDYVITVRYKPVDLLVAGELEDDRVYSKGEIDSIRGTYGKSVYFQLELSTAPGEKETGGAINRPLNSYEEFSARVHELSFNMSQKLALVTGADTVYPSLAHYERGYELENKHKFLIAFPLAQSENFREAVFVYYDDIFETGLQKFKFEIDHINSPEVPITYLEK